MKVRNLPRAVKIAVLLVLFLSMEHATGQPALDKPRTIVTTDGEIDDVDSFVRMLLYANEFHLEGLVYSSSMWHYKGDGKGTKFISEMEMTRNLYGERTDLRWPGTQWMQELIDAYDAVYPNLSSHAEGFPTAAYLRSLIKVGNIDFEGEMEKITEGSEFIKQKLLDGSNTPIYLQVWGGTNTIARALKSIEEEYGDKPDWNNLYQKICNKAIIFTIMDQDATYKKYISQVWPDIQVYYNARQFWALAYNWKQMVPQVWQHYLGGDFMGRHIIHDHGPLTKKYYSYGDGQRQEGDGEHIHGDPAKLQNAQWGTFQPYDFISEGDSPAFLHLINVGLENLAHPDYGGWGGRLKPSETHPKRWEDGAMVAEYNPFTNTMDNAFPQTRWIPALQLDFAARADWCVKGVTEANHPPQVAFDHPKTLRVKPGETIALRAKASDPDGDPLAYAWWHYGEVDSYPRQVPIIRPYLPETILQVPKDLAPGEDIHIILEVTDGQFPNMTRYQRMILQAASE